MTATQRPRRLIVVAVLWILIGALAAQSALGLLVPSVWIGADSFGIAMLLAGGFLSLATAVAGIASGVALLRLRRWSRLALEILTWVYCGICLAAAALGVYLFVTWANPSDRWVPAISMLAYPPLAVGFGVMLWALRSRKMREALAVTVEQAPQPDSAPGDVDPAGKQGRRLAG